MLKVSVPLLLASSSRYRSELLGRLRLPFTAKAPDIDESPLPAESAQALAVRLAAAKARHLSTCQPGCWVLGSDQAADCGGRILGKPGNHLHAVEQLLASSGRELRFYTAVALVRDGQLLQALDLTTVHFRQLTLQEIERYLQAEPAYDCAGSFKCEGLGASLFERIDSEDPTGLIGLPLIAVSRLLREAGYTLP